MSPEEFTFHDDDDDAFKTLISEYLAKGAAEIRGITPKEYVEAARAKWSTCEKDNVYAIKLLFDPLVQPQFREESAEEMFCVLVARVDHRGELINVPPGYEPPSFPGVRLSHIVAGSPSGGHEPDPSKPEAYILAYLDVLGFESLLRRCGLDEIYALYTRLLDTALAPQSEARPWAKALSTVQGELVPALMWLPIHTAYFSDSLLLWVQYHPGHVQEFLERCGRVFCEALHLGLPLRGAVTVGRAVLNKDRNIYLGEPLVEAARLEGKLDWIGVVLGASFKSEAPRVPVPPHTVLPFTPPLKTGGGDLFSDLVVDWPRVWRESSTTASAIDRLQSLCRPDLPEALQERYRNAVLFYKYSDKHQNWFLPEGATRIKV